MLLSGCILVLRTAQLIGTLFNWLLFGALLVQTCGYILLPLLDVLIPTDIINKDVYYLHFGDDKIWQKALGECSQYMAFNVRLAHS